MHGFITRFDEDANVQVMACSLHISTNGKGTLYFEEKTPKIGLNDGKYHEVMALNFFIRQLSMDDDCINLTVYIESDANTCFRDGFCFHFVRPAGE
jgi:hypothetical protein